MSPRLPAVGVAMISKVSASSSTMQPIVGPATSDRRTSISTVGRIARLSPKPTTWSGLFVMMRTETPLPWLPARQMALQAMFGSRCVDRQSLSTGVGLLAVGEPEPIPLA